jgi:sterol desaturase/sphingolipid hydroxylase (fatty acid hydroxylase superfamily)
VFSDNRQHFAETVVNAAIAYVPARILGLSSPDALRLAALTIYFSALIHTNLRTNLGPLRYVFVSPQAHRVHHSVPPEHVNSNYGGRPRRRPAPPMTARGTMMGDARGCPG